VARGSRRRTGTWFDQPRLRRCSALARLELQLFRTALQNAGVHAEVDNYSRGIVKDRNRLYWEDFKRIPTCYPLPEEQAAIVRYLDHVDRRVRRLVRAKRKLITLLTGRNFATKQYEEAIAEASFGKLKQGVLAFTKRPTSTASP
jgi:hypothetical protein